MAMPGRNMSPIHQTQLILTNNLCTVDVSYWTVITVTTVLGPCCPPACAVLTNKQSSTSVPSMTTNKIYTILLHASNAHNKVFRHSGIINLLHVSHRHNQKFRNKRRRFFEGKIPPPGDPS